MEAVSKYFSAERHESLLFIGVGILAILCALYYLLILKKPFYEGLSWAIVFIALIQLTVGTIVFFRSPKDLERVNRIIFSDPDSIQSEEIPRMNQVMKNFVWYRWIEIALLLSGLVIYFGSHQFHFWKGVGLGLSIQSTLMLILDFFAEQRGKMYLDYLIQMGHDRL